MAELYSIGPLINDANILGYWRLEGNSNDAQSVATQHNGTDTAITYSAANGKFGQGAGYNGTTSSISMGNNLAFANGNAISITFWAKPGTAHARDVVAKNYNYCVGYGPDGAHLDKWTFAYYPGADQVWTSAQSYDNTAFHMITVTYTFGTGSSLKMYYDGVDITSGGSWIYGTGNAAPPSNTNPFVLGTTTGTSYMGALYDGAIDDVAIFNRILTSTEVSQLFQAGVLSRNLRITQAVQRASFY